MIRLKTQRWQLSLASTVSLVVHAMFVLLLYRAYSELRQAQPPTVLISHGDSRTVVLPDLEVELDAVSTMPHAPADSRRRSDELAAAAPRRSLTGSELLALQPRSTSASSYSNPGGFRQRADVFATLKTDRVESPASPAAPLVSPSDLPALAPTNARLPRSELADVGWQPELSARPVRIASLPPTEKMRRAASRLFLESTERSDAGETRIRRPASAFAHRFGQRDAEDERTLAIERGLDFLARVQLDDGRWQFRNLRGYIDPHAESPSPRADAAATGLALLAFLGAGRDHLDARYHRVVDDALQFLIRTQQSNGEFFPEGGPIAGELTRFYGHGIATLALCEAFGMTGDDRLREPAQRALDYLAGAHLDVPDAWRALPGRDADSATVSWQLATLRCGQLAGLRVDPRTIEAAKAFVATSREEEHAATATTTAVGLAMKLHLGGSRNDALLRPAAETLLAHPPEFADEPDPDANRVELPADKSRRDTYYWYYGSEAMFSLGGNDWQNWSRQLYPQLIKTQVANGPLAGSWDARIDQSSTAAGRLYATAMNLLSLEIENRRLHLGASPATEGGTRKEAVTR